MIQQNFLSPTGFQFTIQRLPNVKFFVQSATIPGLSITTTNIPTPFATTFFAGDKMEWDNFSVMIRVDENMEAWNEIYEWMVGLAKPASYDQFKRLKQSDPGLYSDASLIILNSRKNPSLEVKFKDMFPIELGSVELDTTESDVSYRTCTITFKHNGHEVRKL